METNQERSPQDYPNSPWASAAVLIIGAVALIVVALGMWRWGVMLLAAAAGLGAALRLFLPDHLAGLLVVRSRLMDVLVLLAFAVLLAFLGIVTPNTA